jgi:hypothetical protein
MNKNLLLFTFGLLTFLPANLHGVPTAIGLYSKGNKKLLIFGDMHTARMSNASVEIVEKLDKKPMAALQKLLQTVAKESSKSTCIVELYTENKHYNVMMQKYTQNPAQRDCMNTMQYEAIKNKFKLGNLAFIPGDIRELTDTLPALISEVMENTQYILSPTMKTIALESFQKLFPNHTFAAYFSEAKKAIESLKKQLAALTDIPDSAQKYLKDYIATAEANIVKTEKMIAAFPLAGMKHNLMTSQLLDILVDSLLNHKSIQLNALYSTKFLNELGSVSSLVADLGLMQKMLETIKQHDTIIIYVGLTHMRALDSFIKELGFTQIEKVDAAPELTQGYTNVETDEDIMRLAVPVNLMNAMIAKFFQPIEATDAKAAAEKVELKAATVGALAAETLSSTVVEQQDHTCVQCNKQKAEKRCAACKVTYYCSPECQKTNWSQHKALCKQLVKAKAT